MLEPAGSHGRGALLAGALCVLGVHAALAAYFAPFDVLLGADGVVHDAHGITGIRLLSGERGPQPGGILGAIAAAIGEDGDARVRAYGALLLALHLSVPLVGMALARVARSGGAQVVVTGALFSALWWFDSVTHWCWYSGRVGWSCTSLLLPFAVLYGLRLFDRERPIALVGVLVALVASVATLSEPKGVVFASRASLLAYDVLDVLSDGYGAEGNVRAAVRVMVWATALYALVERGLGQLGARVRAGLFGGALVLAYGGGYLRVAWPLDPYLLVVPATFAAAVPCADILVRGARPAVVRTLTPSGRILLALAVLLAAPRLGRTVLTYMPEGMPERVIRTPGDLRVSAAVGANERAPAPLRHAPPPVSYSRVVTRLSEHAPGNVLVRERELAAYLKMHSALPVLGPLRLRGEAATASDPLQSPRLRGAAVPEALRQNAIAWVVVLGPRDPIEDAANVFDAPIIVDGVRLYRVRS